jgi:signal transduction histidine kinase
LAGRSRWPILTKTGLPRIGTRPVADPAAAAVPDHPAARVPLGRELLLNFAVVGGFALALIFTALTMMIQASFGRLEQTELDRQVSRASAYLAENIEQQGLRSKDWGYWDEAYHYVQVFDSGFETRNVTAESFQNAIIDGMTAVRVSDSASRSYFFDPEEGEPDAAIAEELRAIAMAPEYRARLAAKGEVQGYVRLGGELYSIAGIKVLRSDLTGPSKGELTFVKRVDPAAVNKALQLAAQIDLRGLRAATLAERKAERIEVSQPVAGLDGRPVAMLRYALPRGVMAAGRSLRNLALGAVAILLLTMLGMLSRRVRILVLEPVKRLHDHVVAIRSSGELAALGGPAAPNEVGDMQLAFNTMAGDLNALRAELERQSFALGRSQSAIGAMHNVRNSLSPVNVILGTLDQDLAARFPDNARRAIGELIDPATPADRRERLASYLATLLEEHDAAREDARARSREAGRHLASALEAIANSGREGREADYGEACDLGGLLGRAANAARFVDGAAIAVELDCPQRIVARGNRVLLTQIVENLITNAVEAIAAKASGTGRIAVSASADHQTGRCRIVIADDGEGFDPVLGERLFERGYSTRPDKAGGLGLHWCANTINAMGGQLALSSAGQGLGAQAMIELDLAETEAEAPIPA